MFFLALRFLVGGSPIKECAFLLMRFNLTCVLSEIWFNGHVRFGREGMRLEFIAACFEERCFGGFPSFYSRRWITFRASFLSQGCGALSQPLFTQHTFASHSCVVFLQPAWIKTWDLLEVVLGWFLTRVFFLGFRFGPCLSPSKEKDPESHQILPGRLSVKNNCTKVWSKCERTFFEILCFAPLDFWWAALQ